MICLSYAQCLIHFMCCCQVSKAEAATRRSCPPGQGVQQVSKEGTLSMLVHDEIVRGEDSRASEVAPMTAASRIDSGIADVGGALNSSMPDTTYSCATCPPGSYRTFQGGTRAAQEHYCKKCFPGRYAPDSGSRYCRTCPLGTYSAPNGTTCIACPSVRPIKMCIAQLHLPLNMQGVGVICFILSMGHLA